MDARQEVAQAIIAANRRFMDAFARGDAAGVAACYTDDAQFLAPHAEAIQGRAAIEGRMRAIMERVRSLELETVEVEGDGETAWEVGRTISKLEDGTVVDRGKYIVIWKRVGERWLIHRDIINTSLPRR